MNIEKLLQHGIQKDIINEFQKNELLKLLDNNRTETKSNPLVVKFLYYIGAFIALCAMITLMSHTIQNSTYLMILGLGSLYSFIFLGLGEFLWRKNEKFPAGILYFLFIISIAFIILDIEKMTGFFPHFSDMKVHDDYFNMCIFPIITLSTLVIVTTSILQKYRRVSILALPTISCSYAIYISTICLITDNFFEETIFIYPHLLFSLALLLIAFIKDRCTNVDYSKYMYFFGSLGVFSFIIPAFNILLLMDPPAIVIQLEVLILSCVYCIIGSLIQRKVFSIVGILGIIEFIFYLEIGYLHNEIILTGAILITGLIILYAGVLCNQNSEKIHLYIEKLLPEKMRNKLPQNRK